MYTYCSNNPINFFDPTGHILIDADKANLSWSDQLLINYYTARYDEAKSILNGLISPEIHGNLVLGGSGLFNYTVEDCYATMNYFAAQAAKLRNSSYGYKDNYDYTYGKTYYGVSDDLVGMKETSFYSGIVGGGLVVKGASGEGIVSKIVKRIKPINLPSTGKITVAMEHILSGHTAAGNRAISSGAKTLFPSNMTAAQIESAIRAAYANCKRIATQAGRVKVRGTSGGLIIEMWVNIVDKIIESAYPLN